jgi:hypothetical protein
VAGATHTKTIKGTKGTKVIKLTKVTTIHGTKGTGIIKVTKATTAHKTAKAFPYAQTTGTAQAKAQFTGRLIN